MQIHYLYRHIRLDTGEPFYIGIGTVEKRYVNSTSINSYYSRAYNKTDRSAWWKRTISKTDYEVEILLESDDYEFIKQKEIEFITLHGRRDLGKGTLVNLTNGGDGVKGVIRSEETIRKNREKVLGKKRPKVAGKNNPFYGKKHTPETIEKISGENNHMFGKEAWNKGKSFLKDEKHPRAKVLIDTETLTTYLTVKEAAKAFEIRRTNLSRYLSKNNDRKNPTSLIYLEDYIEGKEYKKDKPSYKQVIDIKSGVVYKDVSKAARAINMNIEKLRKKLKSDDKNDTSLRFLD